MPLLYIGAANILVQTLSDSKSRSILPLKKRENVESALRSVLVELQPKWRAQPTHGEAPSQDQIVELERILKVLRDNKAWLLPQISRVRAAVRLRAVPLKDGRGNLPLSLTWLAMKAAISEGQWTIVLPLACYLNNRDVEPPGSAGAVFLEFAKQYLGRCKQKSGAQILRSITNTWNEVAPALSLPAFPEVLPYIDRGEYMLLEADFAPTLLAELDACIASWTTVPRRGRLLNDTSAWARRYDALLTISAFCRATGRTAGEFKSLIEFATDANLVAAFEFMICRARALLPLQDEAYAATLRSLPACIFAELALDVDPGSEFVTVLAHACALEIMMATSRWPYHAARLTLSQHVKRVSDGDIVRLFICIPADETNHGHALEFEIVGISREILETYINRVRKFRPGQLQMPVKAPSPISAI